jgi:hypothetical protein
MPESDPTSMKVPGSSDLLDPLADREPPALVLALDLVRPAHRESEPVSNPAMLVQKNRLIQ